jgi:hypothetical protein
MSEVNGQTKETELFFRQWLRSPKSMGAVIPSSRALARAVSREITWRPGQVIVELGAGTGAISQGLMESGLPPEALMMIELDRPLFEYLRERFPKVRVINGDATRLLDILRQQGIELRRARAGRLPAAVFLLAGGPDPGQEARRGGEAGQVRGAQPAACDGLALPPARRPRCRPWPGERARLNDRSPCPVGGRSLAFATPAS